MAWLRDLRRSYLPELEGPSTLLAELVVIIAIIVIISEMLGTVGLFKLLPVLFGFVGAGLVASTVARRRGSGSNQYHSYADGQIATSSRLVASVAALTVAAVAADWITRTLDSLRYGMSAPDTLWYHMPVAALFAQTDQLSRCSTLMAAHLLLRSVDHGASSWARDSGDGQRHALAHHESWLACVGVVRWMVHRPPLRACAGHSHGVESLATPEFVFLNAGEALNDVAGVSLLLAGIAILINGSSLRGGGAFRFRCRLCSPRDRAGLRDQVHLYSCRGAPGYWRGRDRSPF